MCQALYAQLVSTDNNMQIKRDSEIKAQLQSILRSGMWNT